MSWCRVEARGQLCHFSFQLLHLVPGMGLRWSQLYSKQCHSPRHPDIPKISFFRSPEAAGLFCLSPLAPSCIPPSLNCPSCASSYLVNAIQHPSGWTAVGPYLSQSLICYHVFTDSPTITSLEATLRFILKHLPAS